MYLFAGTAEEQAVIMDASGGVKAGRNSLITAQAELETCDAKIILTVREDIFQNGNGGAAMLGGASILCVLLFLLLLWMMQRMIVHPTNVILKANRELSGGFLQNERPDDSFFGQFMIW